MMLSFCVVLFFLRDVLDEILDLIESVSEFFLPTLDVLVGNETVKTLPIRLYKMDSTMSPSLVCLGHRQIKSAEAYSNHLIRPSVCLSVCLSVRPSGFRVRAITQKPFEKFS